MSNEQLRLLRKAHEEAASLVADLESARVDDMLVASARYVERMIRYALAKELKPPTPPSGEEG